jgi:glycosyltransferase involved in cell wall biosynthesis
VTHLARDSDLVIAVAEEDQADLMARLTGPGAASAAPGVGVRHVPLGNHFEGVAPGFDRTAWRNHLGLAPGAELVGHLGFVNRSKAVDDLVRAIALLVERGRSTHLLMIGESLGTADVTNRTYLEEVRRLVEQLHLTSRVHWTGLKQPDEVGAWLCCLDVAALPFRDGASGRRTSLIAAWSHGVPVVTSEPAHWPAWHEGAPPSATVRVVSGETLAAALEALLDNPERRQQIQAAGTRMAERFSWHRVVEQTLEAYETALLLRRP